MNDYLIECVPNISEGRNIKKVDEIVKNVSRYDVQVLNVDSGFDANRTVITMVGKVSEMEKAIKALYSVTAEVIDMRHHHGTHPRMGAVDVCPFIPFNPAHREDLKKIVNGLANAISEKIAIPIFLYADSSQGGVNKTLPSIRKGGYEKLVQNPKEMNFEPDHGENLANPSFGASVMGVRDFMIAFNVNLSTSDITVAKNIARQMRQIRKEDGKFEKKNIQPLQILGWYMEKYNCCQISTNIHNPRELSMNDVFDFVDKSSRPFNVKATAAELIGMIPEFALKNCLSSELDEEKFTEQLRFNFKGPWSWEDKILERKMRI